MKTSTLLRIYRVTTFVLLAVLALMPLIYRRNIIFATSATVVVTLVLIIIAFQVQRLRMLAGTIAKLDELLEFLRESKRELSVTESKRIVWELEEIRTGLLREKSVGRTNPHN